MCLECERSGGKLHSFSAHVIKALTIEDSDGVSNCLVVKAIDDLRLPRHGRGGTRGGIVIGVGHAALRRGLID